MAVSKLNENESTGSNSGFDDILKTAANFDQYSFLSANIINKLKLFNSSYTIKYVLNSVSLILRRIWFN